jgi:2-C-methyl-D-erythritol 4-phosphate cytidylyltransferase
LGKRFGGKKQIKEFFDRPLFIVTMQPFINSELINEIILVISDEDSIQFHKDIKLLRLSKSIKVVTGGDTRQQSVYNGLLEVDKSSDLICIHDAVRPFVNESLIKKALASIKNHDGVIIALPSTDTIKRVVSDQILETIPRETIWRAQTPQIFFKEPLLEALKFAQSEKINGTDEASLLERIGYQIGFVEGSPFNIKITTSQDWIFAEAIYNYLNQ